MGEWLDEYPGLRVLAETTCSGAAGVCPDPVTAWWDLDLIFQPNVRERRFAYTVLFCLADHMGAAYVPYGHRSSSEMHVGTCTHRLAAMGRLPERVAALDALLAKHRPANAVEFTHEGTPRVKAPWRAGVIADAVSGLLGGRQLTVAMIGTVGLIAEELTARGHAVLVSDMEPTLIGRYAGGVRVQSALDNRVLIKQADVVLATGMILSNGTFPEILAMCREFNRPLCVYAETGSAIAEQLACTGVINLAISEPFPFYIAEGLSRIRLVRSEF